VEEITQWGNISVAESEAYIFYLELGKKYYRLGTIAVVKFVSLMAIVCMEGLSCHLKSIFIFQECRRQEVAYFQLRVQTNAVRQWNVATIVIKILAYYHFIGEVNGGRYYYLRITKEQ
jgi:hypothetical protein